LTSVSHHHSILLVLQDWGNILTNRGIIAPGRAPSSGEAIALAAKNRALVAAGVRPKRAESGYGYQKIGPLMGAKFEARVHRKAAADDRGGGAIGQIPVKRGVFVMRADTLGAKLGRHALALAAAVAEFAMMSRLQLARTISSVQFVIGS
jgi:hypothetical protein